MSKHPVTEKLDIEGPVGKLEAILERPGEGALEGAAVVCHPHPQHGGTMHNKVAHTLARAFVRSGFETLRLSLIHISEPTRPILVSRMPSSA